MACAKNIFPIRVANDQASEIEPTNCGIHRARSIRKPAAVTTRTARCTTRAHSGAGPKATASAAIPDRNAQRIPRIAMPRKSWRDISNADGGMAKGSGISVRASAGRTGASLGSFITRAAKLPDSPMTSAARPKMMNADQKALDRPRFVKSWPWIRASIPDDCAWKVK